MTDDIYITQSIILISIKDILYLVDILVNQRFDILLNCSESC